MAGKVFLEALIEPNPPLTPRAIGLVVGFAAVVSFAAGVMFALHGAWPVTPFFGVDVALLWWAMRASVRASRRREYLRLTSDALLIERISATGHVQREEINPYWLKVEHDDPDLLGADVALVLHKRRWVVGSFLGAEERARLAEALRQALRDARQPLPSE